MKPSRPRFSFIVRLTERLLSDRAVTAPPVPVEAIAKAMGCRIVFGPLQNISGILVRSAEGATIGVNERQPPARRRFTIAHELGHLLLHRGDQITYDHEFRVNLRSVESSEGRDVEEIEANFFAASLLMPDACLDADPRTAFIHLDDDAAVGALAKTFKVSQQAMTLRLARLLGRKA